MTTELLIILGLIALNGFFAMAELAIVSARKTRLKQLADEGSTGAKLALELADDSTRFLSTVQVGITLVSILAGAFGGARIADRLAAGLKLFLGTEDYAQYAEPVALGIVVVAITAMSLILGELVPKRLALARPERIAMSVSPVMLAVTRLATPLAYIISAVTNAVLRLIPESKDVEPVVTDEEIKDLMEQGTEAGTFHEAEAEIVEMALRLGDKRVAALMTPRTLMDCLDLDDPDDVNRKKVKDSPHSRFPLIQGTAENIVGIVQVKDILGKALAGEKFDLRAAAQPALFVPDTAPALKALELFKQSGSPLALVVDEYGHIEGMLTLNDIIVALVGDIPDVRDKDLPGAVQRADGSWLVDGMLPVDDLIDIIATPSFPATNEEGEYNTIGGFVMKQLKRIPRTADSFELEGFRFEVMDMDGRRVDKVLIVPPKEPEKRVEPSTDAG